jgi:hypothetical protein
MQYVYAAGLVIKNILFPERFASVQHKNKVEMYLSLESREQREVPVVTMSQHTKQKIADIVCEGVPCHVLQDEAEICKNKDCVLATKTGCISIHSN